MKIFRHLQNIIIAFKKNIPMIIHIFFNTTIRRDNFELENICSNLYIIFLLTFKKILRNKIFETLF